MNLKIAFLFSIVFLKCPQFKNDRIVDAFIINLEESGIENELKPLKFYNSECHFDNGNDQFQGNSTHVKSGNKPFGYKLWSSYMNFDESKNVVSQIWINIFIEYSKDQTNFTPKYLEDLLESEDSNSNQKHIYPQINVEILGNKFKNFNILSSLFKINENFNYKINDFEVYYKSECIDKDLLFLDLSINGMIYEYSANDKQDSLFLNESNLKLLFEI